MKIQITKLTRNDEKYKADLLDLPGTPPIGEGNSPEEAVASLFFRLLSEKSTNWFAYIKLGTLEMEYQ